MTAALHCSPGVFPFRPRALDQPFHAKQALIRAWDACPVRLMSGSALSGNAISVPGKQDKAIYLLTEDDIQFCNALFAVIIVVVVLSVYDLLSSGLCIERRSFFSQAALAEAVSHFHMRATRAKRAKTSPVAKKVRKIKESQSSAIRAKTRHPPGKKGAERGRNPSRPWAQNREAISC